MSERTVAALEISGGQIIEDQCSLSQVAFGQRPFDASLLRQQPVHRLIEFVLGNRIEMEQFSESAAEGIGVKGPRGSEFGSRLQNAGNDHGQNEIEFAAGMLIDELVEF